MVERHLPLHKTQICLGGKVNTPKNPVESLPRNGKCGRVLHEKFPRMHREGENRETAVNNGKAKGGFDESAHPLPS